MLYARFIFAWWLHSSGSGVKYILDKNGLVLRRHVLFSLPWELWRACMHVLLVQTVLLQTFIGYFNDWLTIIDVVYTGGFDGVVRQRGGAGQSLRRRVTPHIVWQFQTSAAQQLRLCRPRRSSWSPSRPHHSVPITPGDAPAPVPTDDQRGAGAALLWPAVSGAQSSGLPQTTPIQRLTDVNQHRVFCVGKCDLHSVYVALQKAKF